MTAARAAMRWVKARSRWISFFGIDEAGQATAFPRGPGCGKCPWLAIRNIEDLCAAESAILRHGTRAADGHLREGSKGIGWNQALPYLMPSYPDRLEAYLGQSRIFA